MSYNFNKFIVEGNLVDDAKQSEKAVIMTIANHRGKHTNFIRVVWAKKISPELLKALTKGRKIIVDGDLSFEKGEATVFAQDVQRQQMQVVVERTEKGETRIISNPEEIEHLTFDPTRMYRQDIFEM